MIGDNISTNMGDKVVKVLDIRVNYSDAIKELGIYRQSLEKTTQAEKDLKAEFEAGRVSQEDYNKQMSALTQNKKALQAATRDVTRTVQNNIKAEKEHKGSLTQLRAQLSNLVQQYDRLSASQRNGIRGSQLKAQINDITKTIKDAEMATQRFYRNVGNYQSALLGLRELGGAFKTFGGTVTAVLGGLGINEVANTMLNVAKNFEDAMARVRSVANPDSGEFQQMRDRAIELGATTRYTATEVGNAMEELARKGYSAAEVTRLVGDTLMMAQANVTSIADAATIASNSMRAFGFGAEEITRVADVMSSACANSATNLTQLGEAMKTAAPAARAANVSLEQTVSLVGALANIGMTGSDAGTGVKQILMAVATMAKSTDKARKVLEHYNLDITEARLRTGDLMEMLKEMKMSGIGESLADLKLVSGKYASPRLANLINNIDEAIQLEETLKQSWGENERMYNQSIGNTSQAFFMLKSAWESMLIGMYDSTSEYLINPIKWLTEAIRWATKNVDAIGQTLVSVLAGLMAHPVWKGLKTLGGVIGVGFTQSSAVIKAQLNGIRIAGAVAGAELKAAFTAPSTVSWKTLFASIKAGASSTIGLCKTGISSLIVGVKSLGTAIATSFAPFLVVMGIVEAYQGIKRMLELTDEVEHAWENFNKNIETAQSETDNERIHALTTMKDMLNDINKEQIQNNGLTDQSLKNLIAIANRLDLSKESQKKLYEIQQLQLKEQQKLIKAQESGNQKAAAAAKAKLNSLKVEKGVYDEIAKKIQDNIEKEKKAAAQKAVIGMLTEVRSGMANRAIETEMKKLGIDPMDTEAVARQVIGVYEKQSTADKAMAVTGAGFGVHTTYYWKKEAEKALKIVKFANDWLKENGLPEEMPKFTPSGDFNPSGIGGGRGGNAKFDLLPYIAWVEKQLNTTSAKLETDQEEQDAKKIIAQYDNIVVEVQKKLDELDKAKEEGKKINKEERKKFLQFVSLLIEKLPQAQANDLWNLSQKYNIKDIEEEISGLQREIDNLSKVNTYPTDGKSQGSYPQFEKYSKKRQILSQQKEKEDSLLMEQFVKGAFGEVFQKGTYDKALEGYNKYVEQLNRIRNDKVLSQEDKDKEEKELNAQNKAEAEFYERSMLLEQKYDNDMSALTREEFAEESKMRAQFIENQLSAEQLKYERMLNMAYDYYQNLQNYIWDSDINDWIWQPTEEYFKELGGRIGEFEANELKMELEIAKQELQSIVNAGYDERVESYENYQARVIEAKKKVVEVHTKANVAIEQSDETRFQAAQTVTEGLIKLTEEMGQEDKEAAKLAKTLALFNIFVNTAEAIAKMTSRESGKGVIGIGTAAAGIATILANMASAVSILKQAKFAKGAVNIGGAGSETSDSIPAYISRGESVMNAKATKMFEPLLIAMNAIGNGVALPRNNYVRTQQTADITEAFTEAVANVRPVVDVREVTRVQNKVEILQNLDSI